MPHALACFTWRSMDSPPDQRDEVFALSGKTVHAGRIAGGNVYFMRGSRRYYAPVDKWAQLDAELELTAADVGPYRAH
jgi:hypothetical protein